MAFTEKGHINRRTQFENSVLEAKRRLELQMQSQGLSALPLPLIYREKPLFTRDPTQLKGTFLSTALQRSNVGFGFTIIGGYGGSFLQVNRVIPGSPVAQDGKVDTGDVIVYINDICVLGATQADVAKLIQSVPIGQSVTLVLCRGDPLPEATAQAPELLTVTMVKGSEGFGFTIVPSPNGQRVKQVLEPGSQGASGLMAGDLILEVNQQPVAAAGHGRVVELLRECPVGSEATLLIQRSGTGKIAMEKRRSALIRAPFSETDSTDSGVSMKSASSMFDLPNLQRAPFSETDSTDSGVSMKSASSMFDLPNLQRAPFSETDSTDSGVSMKSASSMFDPPNFNLHRKQRAPFSETDSTDTDVSMKSASSMYEPPSFNLHRKQRAPFSETDSTDTDVSMKSASSMYEPPSFNLHRKQSCAVCEEAVRNPVLLPCGHWSCKECSHSFWDEYGLTADDPCKKCGRRTEREKRDQDLRSVLLEKTIKRVEMETEKFQAEKEKLQAEKGSFQAEKEKLQAEKGSFQAEKEKFQAEKERFEFEKRKLALEIQSLELNCKYTNYDQDVVIPKIRIPYI